MRQEEIDKLRLGMACCIQANQTHHCPPECPYTDCTVGATYTYCEGALLLEARAYIEQLERRLDAKAHIGQLERQLDAKAYIEQLERQLEGKGKA